MRAWPLRRFSAVAVAPGTLFFVTHWRPEAMWDTQGVAGGR
jgi:hypothetical protein